MTIKEWNELVEKVKVHAEECKTSICGGSWHCYRCGGGCECEPDERTPVWEFEEEELVDLIEFVCGAGIGDTE